MLMFFPVPLLLAMTVANSIAKGAPSRVLIGLSGIAGITAIFFFIVAQAYWVVNEYNEELPEWVVNVWLAFDGANAAYYLASSSALYVQSVWIKRRRGYEEVKRMVGMKCEDCTCTKCPAKKKPS